MPLLVLLFIDMVLVQDPQTKKIYSIYDVFPEGYGLGYGGYRRALYGCHCSNIPDSIRGNENILFGKMVIFMIVIIKDILSYM